MPALIQNPGRHRLAETQPIALPPAAPMHGRLSRPLRPVPTADPTTAMPALRLLPPAQPERIGLTLTRRGHIAAAVVGGAALGPALYGFWSAVGAIGQLVGVQ